MGHKGKSKKNALYVLQYTKRHFSGQSNVIQCKNQTCSHSHYQVTLVQKAFTKLLRNLKIFCWMEFSTDWLTNWLKNCTVNLKVCLILPIVPHHCLEKLRLAFGLCYFVGHAYSFVAPTLHYCCSICCLKRTTPLGSVMLDMTTSYNSERWLSQLCSALSILSLQLREVGCDDDGMESSRLRKSLSNCNCLCSTEKNSHQSYT